MEILATALLARLETPTDAPAAPGEARRGLALLPPQGDVLVTLR